MKSIKEQLYAIIDRDKEELFTILSDLVKINSENFGVYGNETECPEFVGKFFEEIGYKADIYSPLDVENIERHPDFLKGQDRDSKKNCTVVIPGKNRSKRLMLAAHFDTVPIGIIDDWKVDPLGGEIKDGKIYGRGVGDDKHGIAIGMFLIKKLKELNIELDYDLLLSAYCDEEVGGNGALATCLKYPFDDCLYIDGIENEIEDNSCGGGGMKIDVTSKEIVTNCSNVVKGLNLLLDELYKFGERRRAEIEECPLYLGTCIAEDAFRLYSVVAGAKPGIDNDKGYIRFNFHTLREKYEIDEEIESIIDSLKDEFEALGLNRPTVEMTTRYFNAVKRDDKSFVVDKIMELSKENDYEVVRRGGTLSDLPIFNIDGSPRAVCLGIIRNFNKYGGAHQADEFIECDDLVKMTKIIAGFIAEY